MPPPCHKQNNKIKAQTIMVTLLLTLRRGKYSYLYHKKCNPCITLNVLLGSILLIFMWRTTSGIILGFFLHTVYSSHYWIKEK